MAPTSLLPSLLPQHSLKLLVLVNSTTILVSFRRIPGRFVLPTQDAALFTSWLAQCATIKYTTRTGEQSCESNITKQQKNSWRCFVSRHNNRDAAVALGGRNGEWRCSRRVNILLANGDANARERRIVMHESCGSPAPTAPTPFRWWFYNTLLSFLAMVALRHCVLHAWGC